MRTLIVILFAVVLTSVGELLLAYGMRRIGEANWSRPTAWLAWLGEVVINPYILLGVVFVAGFFIVYLATLTWADLSLVMPLTALSYVFGALLAIYFLNEEVSLTRWAGIIVIVIGVSLIGLDSRKNERTWAESDETGKLLTAVTHLPADGAKKPHQKQGK